MNRLTIARNDDIAWRVNHCNRDIRREWFEYFLDTRFVCQRGDHLSFDRPRLNQTAAFRDESQSIFQTEHARHACRCVLAHAVTDDNVGFDAP